MRAWGSTTQWRDCYLPPQPHDCPLPVRGSAHKEIPGSLGPEREGGRRGGEEREGGREERRGGERGREERRGGEEGRREREGGEEGRKRRQKERGRGEGREEGEGEMVMIIPFLYTSPCICHGQCIPAMSHVYISHYLSNCAIEQNIYPAKTLGGAGMYMYTPHTYTQPA